MQELFYVLGLLAVYFLITRLVLPSLGVPT